MFVLLAGCAAHCWDSPTGDDWVDVQAGLLDDVTCGLHGDGRVECWGDDELQVPTEPVAAFDVGAALCWLAGDGGIDCGGHTGRRRPTVPDGVDFVALAAGSSQTCGLTGDGDAVCDDSLGPMWMWEDAPAPLSRVCAGHDYNCGITTAGNLACWAKLAGSVVPPTGTFQSIDCGEYEACAVTEAGDVVCWSGEDVSSDIEGHFVSVAAGPTRCGVGTDGRIVCESDDVGAIAGPEGDDFVDVATGYEQICGLRRGSEIACVQVEHGRL